MAKETTPLDAEEARGREEAKLTGDPQHKIMLEHMAGTWDRICETSSAVMVMGEIAELDYAV